MPRGNGTGPTGKEPGTGRGRGPCGVGQRQGLPPAVGVGQGPGREGRRGHGDLVLLTAFGGGLICGTALARW